MGRVSGCQTSTASGSVGWCCSQSTAKRRTDISAVVVLAHSFALFLGIGPLGQCGCIRGLVDMRLLQSLERLAVLMRHLDATNQCVPAPPAGRIYSTSGGSFLSHFSAFFLAELAAPVQEKAWPLMKRVTSSFGTDTMT